MTEIKLNETQTWLRSPSVTPDFAKKIVADYHLPKKFLHYIQDQRERARLEYDEPTGYWLLIFRVSQSHHRAEHYGTQPMAFIFNDQRLLTLYPNSKSPLHKAINSVQTQVQQGQLTTIMAVVNACLLQVVTDYFDVIDAINDRRSDLENSGAHPTNEAINQLTDLSKSLVYLTTACNNNEIALRQLQLAANAKDDILQLTKSEKQHLGEVIVEAKQALEMAQIATDVVDRIANAYNNLLNNRLNDTMRFLTIWSIILMIPPIISGFYGMNVKLPLADKPFSWIMTVVWTLILILVLIWRFYRNRDK